MEANDVTIEMEFPIADAMEATAKRLLESKNSGDEELNTMLEDLQDKLVKAQNQMVEIQKMLVKRKIRKNLNS